MLERVFCPNEESKILMWVTVTTRKLDPNKRYKIRIEEDRNKRSLDANRMFWAICSAIAECLQSDKDSIYLLLLERYGAFTTVLVPPEEIAEAAQVYRVCNDLGIVTVDGQQWRQLQCFKGSSQYDSKQMARLIDGAISELNELEIPHSYDDVKQRALAEWGR